MRFPVLLAKLTATRKQPKSNPAQNKATFENTEVSVKDIL